MEVSNGLLVAMMFIMILSIGIGNILMSLPPLLDRSSKPAVSRVQLSWVALLLLLHLDLFWQVLFFLEIEEWGFGSFLYVVTGPILLFLATSTLLPDAAQTRDDSEGDYLQASRVAFALLALVMLWLAGIDLVLGLGLQLGTLWNLAALVLFATLAASTNLRVHTVGAVLAWMLLLSMLTARGFGLVD